MTTYTVKLESGLIGTINSDSLDGQSPQDFLGEMVNVHFFDECGNNAEAQGVLSEIIDEE